MTPTRARTSPRLAKLMESSDPITPRAALALTTAPRADDLRAFIRRSRAGKDHRR